MQKKSALTLFWAPVLYSLMGAGALWAQPASDAATVAKGKRLFMRCAACHDGMQVTPGKTGPSLKGVVGRPAGSLAGYGYSADMKTKSFVWDDAQLDAWLIKPTALVPGTTMAFIGMPDAAERKATIAFLRSLK
jgi:cytochrome c